MGEKVAFNESGTRKSKIKDEPDKLKNKKHKNKLICFKKPLYDYYVYDHDGNSMLILIRSLITVIVPISNPGTVQLLNHF